MHTHYTELLPQLEMYLRANSDGAQETASEELERVTLARYQSKAVQRRGGAVTNV
ncbi:hypothetical protein SARC_18081, partial [Sphaeroforma arctica JP610]